MLYLYSMQKITVLGAGMVGRAMAIDLARDYEVTSADLSATNLKKLESYGIHTRQTNLWDAHNIREVIAGADLVVGAVPGFMGFQTLKTVIEAGKNCVDISFFDEDPFLLDELAREKGVTAVMDVGVAPGMDNILLGYHNKRMQVDRFVCLVGGLPSERKWPFEYKAPFSPSDVLEEYTRPARYVRDGQMITMPALSEPELMDFEGVGTLEAFNSDGLRSLIRTMPDIPNMVERTLRYPGHIELMRVLRASGFFSKTAIDIDGHPVRPLDLTSILLFPHWELGPEEEEFTVMRVVIEGMQDGEPASYTYELLDRYDPETRTSSMSRTTGYTCTAAARLVLHGAFDRKGIFPPEFLGEEEDHVRFIMHHLKDRGVVYKGWSYE